MERKVAGGEVAGANFIDPRALARISDLELVARTVVEGFINGLHRSPYLGLSLDFAEHRPYMPGDDLRRIDWRLWARTDRLYVKQFEAETNTNFVAILDVSRSMSFGSQGLTKLDYARFLVATLAYFSRSQRDRVGLVTFDADIVDEVPPSAKHLEMVLHTLARARASGAGGLAVPLRKLAERFRRRSILAVVSDFYHEPEEVVEAVRWLRYRGNDIIVFHVLDPAELEFPYDGGTSFEDLETGLRLPVMASELRERYRALVREHTARLSRLFAEERIDYVLLDTARPLDHALFDYLSSRERLSRVR